MTAQRWRRVATVIAACAVALAGLVLVRPAVAAPNQYAKSIGFATTTPLSGAVAENPRLIASAPCPAGTTALNAFVDSTAAGLAGAVAIAADTTNISSVNTTGAPLSFNFLDIAASQGKVLVNGRYEVSLVCLPDLFGSPGLGQFDAVFTVSGGATATSAGTTYTFSPGGNVTGTTTALAANPAAQGKLNPPTDDITLTATVTPATAGTVQFSDQPGNGAATDLGTAVTVDPNGRATLALGSLASRPADGAHRFRATFTPADPAKFTGSTSPDLSYRIIGATQTATTVTLTADPPVAVTKGSSLTLTAKVAAATTAGGAAPAGTVSFLDGAVELGQASVVDGTATVTLKPTVAGTLALRATFVPADPVTFAGSTSAPDLTYLVSEPLSEGVFLGLLTLTSPNAEGFENQGRATDPLQLKAGRGCPTGSSVVTMRISGPGTWSAGFPIASSGFFSAAGINVPTDQSVADVASLNGLAIVPGLYFVAATCRVSTFDPTATGFFVGQLWFYDAENWLNQDPAKVGIPTVTGLEVTPDGRSDLGGTVTLTATVTPADAQGEIEFVANSDSTGDVPVGTVPLKAGKAVFTTTSLALGLYYVTAAYKPDPLVTTHNASTSSEVVYAVAKQIPPLPQKPAAIAGTAAVGRTVTCTSSFKNALLVDHLWTRDGVLIIGATKPAYRPVTGDAGHLLRCRATASNRGGFVYRESPPVRVGR